MSLHWESAGDGEPVLLIAGLALPGRSWWRTVPVLAGRFRVLTYDHSGELHDLMVLAHSVEAWNASLEVAGIEDGLSAA